MSSEQSKIQNLKSKIVISSREEADGALQEIAAAERRVAVTEKVAGETIDRLRTLLVSDTAGARQAIADRVAALEKWAEANKEDLFKEPRSIEMNFGTVGFRWTPWKIATLGKLKVETIIAKIRAAKLNELIRTKKEVDKEKAVNYTPEDLARCGLKKTRKDEFFYEVKKEEVK